MSSSRGSFGMFANETKFKKRHKRKELEFSDFEEEKMFDSCHPADPIKRPKPDPTVSKRKNFRISPKFGQ